jgi:hypothetical protein
VHVCSNCWACASLCMHACLTLAKKMKNSFESISTAWWSTFGCHFRVSLICSKSFCSKKIT